MPGKRFWPFALPSFFWRCRFPPTEDRQRRIFARETGRACVGCHLDPSGGGELNPAGKAYLAGRAEAGKTTPVSSPFHRGSGSPPASFTC